MSLITVTFMLRWAEVLASDRNVFFASDLSPNYDVCVAIGMILQGSAKRPCPLG